MNSKPFQTVCIVGAGYMGAQIGLQCAVHGYFTWIVDPFEDALRRAEQRNAVELNGRATAGLLNQEDPQASLGRLHYTPRIEEGAPPAGLVIEAVSEVLEMKRAVFTRLDEICPSETILATTSSSIRISTIEDATHRPERVLNAHFFPPLWKRNIVELMRGSCTSEETMAWVAQFARSIGVIPLLVNKESTGFMINRVWRAVKKECLHLVDAGVASPEDVDRAWMILWDVPTGPFGMMDIIGLDVVRDIEMVYFRESGDPSDAPPKLLLDKIERGELGQKSGKGFYTYPNPSYQNPNWLKSGE